MPISNFQKQVLKILKQNRNPESYIAGGTAIQRHADSLRFSADIDIFHDVDLAVLTAFNSDRKVLVNSGYTVDVHIFQPIFYRATVAQGMDQVKLEWVRDTAFRFFPVIEDELLGFRLHDIDLAINKCLALANRSAVRDALDIIDLDRNVLSLDANICAACGKDPGFTPGLILDMILRHSNFSPDLLAAEALARPVDAKQLKQTFLALIADAQETVAKIPPQHIGYLFIDNHGKVIQSLKNLDLDRFKKHMGTVRGSWPLIV